MRSRSTTPVTALLAAGDIVPQTRGVAPRFTLSAVPPLALPRRPATDHRRWRTLDLPWCRYATHPRRRAPDQWRCRAPDLLRRRYPNHRWRHAPYHRRRRAYATRIAATTSPATPYALPLSRHRNLELRRRAPKAPCPPLREPQTCGATSVCCALPSRDTPQPKLSTDAFPLHETFSFVGGSIATHYNLTPPKPPNMKPSNSFTMGIPNSITQSKGK